MRLGRLAVFLLLLPLHPCAAQSTNDRRYVRAVSTLYATAQLGGLVKSWCDARAPETQAATDTALSAWKSANRLDEIEARAITELESQLPALRTAVAARKDEVFARLDKDSRSPAADCPQLLANLDKSANPQRLHPAELRLAQRFRRAPTQAGRVR